MELKAWAKMVTLQTFWADVGNTSERIDLRNYGLSLLKGIEAESPSVPQSQTVLQPYQGKGEVMDLGTLASETILEAKTALCKML